MGKRFNGFIHLYTGSGKGKTTAAIGLAVRAVGAGKKVLFAQFMKTADFSEHVVLKKLDNIDLVTFGKPFFIATEEQRTRLHAVDAQEVVFFIKGNPPRQYIEMMRKGLESINEKMSSYDVIILDEIALAIYFGLLTVNEVFSTLGRLKTNQDAVLTGRNSPPELIEIADIVTEMVEIKHYYKDGIRARKGIDE